MTVLIVGAGPTGLTLAIELAKQGIDFRIIDQKLGPSEHSKALVIQPRTLEIFETMGIVDKFLLQGRTISQISYHHKKKTLPFSFENSSTNYPFILVLPQSETEKILLEELKKWGKEVQWGHQLLGNHTIVKNDHSFEKAVYDWLVASDGAHSTVRELHHIPFVGNVFPETFFLADMIVNTELPQNQVHLICQDSPILLIPLTSPNHFRMVTPLENSPSSDAETLIRKKTKNFYHSFSLESLQWVSFFHIQRRVAAQFQKKKILLLGDAAHVHSPIGGQGMNTSIQDAFNLSWKLGYNIKKKSPISLVRSYERERRPVAKTLIKWTTHFTRLFNLGNKFPTLLFYVIKTINSSKKLQKKIRESMMGFSINYEKSSLSWKSKLKGIQAGERVPNCTTGDSTLYALLKKKKFVLLINSSKLKFLEHFTYSELICHQLHEQPFIHKNRIGSNEFLLIRPDGYLALRGHFHEQKKLENYLIKLFHPSLRK